MNIVLIVSIVALLLFVVVIYLFYFRWSTNVPDYMAARHYRFGKPTFDGPISGKRVLVIPEIDHLVLIDKRIQKSNLKDISLLTKERQRMTLSITIIWKPIDAAKTIENIKPEDIEPTFFKIVESVIKNECTKMSVEGILENSRDLEETVKVNLHSVADTWGITVNSSSISNIMVDNAEFIHNMALPKEIELEKAAKLAQISEEQTVALKTIEKEKISKIAELELKLILELKKEEIETEVKRLHCERDILIEDLKQRSIEIATKNEILLRQAEISTDAERIKTTLLAEAEGVKEKLAVINSFTSSAANYELVKILPEIYKNIGLGEVTLIESTGGNNSNGFNFMSNIIGSAYSIMDKLKKDSIDHSDNKLFELKKSDNIDEQ